MSELFTPELRRRARDCFGLDDPRIDVRVAARPHRRGSVAHARYPYVFLSPEVTDLSRLEHRFVLGHELAHLRQQAERRVPESEVGGERERAALEAEADRGAARFVDGARFRRDRAPARRDPCAVAQPFVRVGTRTLSAEDALSARATAVVELIDGGPEWLDWAIGETTETFVFEDETELLCSVQEGLHGSPLVLLPRLGLLISPVRLMAFADEEIAALQEADASDPSALERHRASRILTDAALVTSADASLVSEALDSLKVSEAAVFQSLRTADLFELRSLVDALHGSESGEVDAAQEAARFAVAHARNASEFVDYLGFYSHVSARLGGTRGQARKRRRRADGALTALVPLLVPYLSAPTADRLLAPSEVRQIWAGWVGARRRVAFASLGRASAVVGYAVAVESVEGEALSGAVDAYLDKVGTFVAEHEPSAGVPSQDGRSYRYEIEVERQSATLSLDRAGCLTLERVSIEAEVEVERRAN